MSYLRLLLTSCLSLFTLIAQAQDLTGIWRGHFLSGDRSILLDSMGSEERYKFETQILQTGKNFNGVTYSYRTTVFYGKASCAGTINSQNHKVLLEEMKLIEVRSITGSACLMTCFLQYSTVGGEEFLEGKYSSMSLEDSSQCGSGTIFLRKVPVSDFYEEPFLAEREKQQPPPASRPAPAKPKPVSPPVTARKTPPAPAKTPEKKPVQQPSASAKKPAQQPAKQPVLTEKKPETRTPAPAPKTTLPETAVPIPPDNDTPSAPMVVIPQVLRSRTNELVKTITTSAEDVYVKIYDNGTIDNDTVSVYVDKKLVISRQRLTEKAIVVKLKLNRKTGTHELIMVAENLGEIPPNTSLMVVSAGDKQYEVRITSTEQKNAAVLFRYEPE